MFPYRSSSIECSGVECGRLVGRAAARSTSRSGRSEGPRRELCPLHRRNRDRGSRNEASCSTPDDRSSVHASHAPLVRPCGRCFVGSYGRAVRIRRAIRQPYPIQRGCDRTEIRDGLQEREHILSPKCALRIDLATVDCAGKATLLSHARGSTVRVTGYYRVRRCVPDGWTSALELPVRVCDARRSGLGLFAAAVETGPKAW